MFITSNCYNYQRAKHVASAVNVLDNSREMAKCLTCMKSNEQICCAEIFSSKKGMVLNFFVLMLHPSWTQGTLSGVQKSFFLLVLVMRRLLFCCQLRINSPTPKHMKNIVLHAINYMILLTIGLTVIAVCGDKSRFGCGKQLGKIGSIKCNDWLVNKDCALYTAFISLEDTLLDRYSCPDTYSTQI